MEKKPVRLYYVDWIRILAVLLLIPFHTARIFDEWEPFYAKNDQVSGILSYFIGFVNQWQMPLLFFLAGAASSFALDFRTCGDYALERLNLTILDFTFAPF